MNNSKIQSVVLTNTIKMLTNRGLLKQDKLEDNIKKVISTQTDINEYEIKLDYPEKYYKPDNDKFYIKIIRSKIKGLAKNSTIGEFLTKYKNQPKLVIVESITPKLALQAEQEYAPTEIFVESSLMIDKIAHISVPKHELLNEEDTNLILQEYMVRKIEMPRIFVTDPIAKYYNAPVGRIFRIIRSSETSGVIIYYRLVV